MSESNKLLVEGATFIVAGGQLVPCPITPEGVAYKLAQVMRENELLRYRLDRIRANFSVVEVYEAEWDALSTKDTEEP